MNFEILFLTISAMWVTSEVMLGILVRSTKNSQDQDKGTLKLLNIIIYSCVTLAVIFGFSGIGYIHTTTSIIPWIGLCVIIAGLMIRWTAILTLRKYFTVNVVIQSNHRIIKNGMYRFVRHPSYSGAIISFCGLGLAFCNGISIIVLTVPITIAFLKRIHIEEKALMSAFGEEYINYRKISWALFPWLY
jgi:protein-S-isoprenylcysteine O-methyltransferase Ste14